MTHGKRRALGQHFLRDPGICQTIVEEGWSRAMDAGCKALLEIGPGKGALTELILKRFQAQQEIEELIVAERDRDLAAQWKQRAESLAKVRIEEGDFLDLPEGRWLERTPLAVISNLPYSAGTAIFTRLAALPGKIPVLVLMFQAEVAQRLRAETGTKSWGSLSAWTQNRWDVRKLLSVAPGAFAPPPEVNSEVVVLAPLSKARVPSTETPEGSRLWQQLLHAAFAHRRKMLRAGLRGVKPWENTLARSGVDGTKRAEALAWDEWDRLLKAALSGQS